MIASQREVDDALDAIRSDELLEKVFGVVGKQQSATSYEVAKLLERPLERTEIESLNQKIESLQKREIVVTTPDTFDPSNLFISMTPKGFELYKHLIRKK
jgi:hypothetical protein